MGAGMITFDDIHILRRQALASPGVRRRMLHEVINLIARTWSSPDILASWLAQYGDLSEDDVSTRIVSRDMLDAVLSPTPEGLEEMRLRTDGHEELNDVIAAVTA